MRARRLPLGLAVAMLLAVAGCGDGGNSAAAPIGPGPGPASAVPADAVVYGEVLLRPSGDVGEGVRTAIRRVALIDDPGAEIAKLLEDENGPDFSYARDVEPWLGDRIGGFLLMDGDEPEGAAVAAVRDREEFDRALGRLREKGDQRPAGAYRGVDYDRDADDNTYLAVVDDLAVAGTLPAVKAAIDASKGASLADSDRYQSAIDPLDDDRLALVYADPRLVADALAGADLDLPAETRRELLASEIFEGDPATLTLTARADEIAIELSGDFGDALAKVEGEGEVSVGELPGDAWAALATPPLGPALRSILDLADVHDDAAWGVTLATGLDLDRDVLDALGGLALFARGTTPLDLGGGLLLRTTSAAAATRLVRMLETVVAADVGPTRPAEVAGGRGFELRIPGSPQPIVVVAREDEIAAGYAASSARDLLDPQSRFDESVDGKAAIATLGDGYVPSVVLVVPPIVDLLDSLDRLGVADLGDVLPYLRGYRSLAAGTKRDDDRVTVRVVAALR